MVEQAEDSGRAEDELSCVALQIARCGPAAEAQKPQGASAGAWILPAHAEMECVKKVRIEP